MTTALKKVFKRDLLKLKKEIQLYKDDTTLWQIENSIKNSGGNLCLHLIGNLKTFIGNGITDIGYQRKRDFEFSGKFVDRNKLYREIDETIEIVDHALTQITEEQLDGYFPMLIWEEKTEMVFTLIHLHGHLTYHLGQINYHRRILEKG